MGFTRPIAGASPGGLAHLRAAVSRHLLPLHRGNECLSAPHPSCFQLIAAC
jgi:hypothetical protein